MLLKMKKKIEDKIESNFWRDGSVVYRTGLRYALEMIDEEITSRANWVRELLGDTFDLSGVSDDRLYELYADSSLAPTVEELEALFYDLSDIPCKEE